MRRYYCLLNGYEQCGRSRECCMYCKNLPTCREACPTAAAGRACEYRKECGGAGYIHLMDDNPVTEEINYPQHLAQAIIGYAVKDLVNARAGKKAFSEAGTCAQPEVVMIEVQNFLESEYFKVLAEAAWPDNPPEGMKLYETVLGADMKRIKRELKAIEKHGMATKKEETREIV